MNLLTLIWEKLIQTVSSPNEMQLLRTSSILNWLLGKQEEKTSSKDRKINLFHPSPSKFSDTSCLCRELEAA